MWASRCDKTQWCSTSGSSAKRRILVLWSTNVLGLRAYQGWFLGYLGVQDTRRKAPVIGDCDLQKADFSKSHPDSSRSARDYDPRNRSGMMPQASHTPCMESVAWQCGQDHWTGLGSRCSAGSENTIFFPPWADVSDMPWRGSKERSAEFEFFFSLLHSQWSGSYYDSPSLHLHRLTQCDSSLPHWARSIVFRHIARRRVCGEGPVTHWLGHCGLRGS